MLPTRRQRALVIIAFTLLIAGGSYVESAEPASPAAKGEKIAKQLCARCHSIAADGKSPHGHAPPFRVLPSRYPVANLAEAFAEGIVVTHKDMPQFVFDPDEIEAILSFIDSLAPEARTKPQPQRK